MDVERLIKTAPVKARFGPSLPQLLAPRIDRLPVLARRIGALVLVAIVALIVAIVVRAHTPVFAYPGPPTPFATAYTSGLTRVAAPPGALVRLERRDASGLVASIEISRLRVPRYNGEISGLWPVFAANQIRRLGVADGPTFHLQSQGRTRIRLVPAYTFTYSRTIDGRLYYGRVVFITRDIKGDTGGYALAMITRPSALDAATWPRTPTPDDVGTVGSLLFLPYQGFHFT